MAEPSIQKYPRLPVSLALELERRAREEGVSENSIFIEALRRYLAGGKKA